MSTSAARSLRAGWPLVGVALSFVIGVALGGMGGGVLAATLGVLAFGPAYLIANHLRRRETPPPAPKAEDTKARSDARFLRAYALVDLGIAVVALAAAFERGDWFPGDEWTVVLLFFALLALSAAPKVWAIAELRENQRTLRWAWALSGSFSLALGAGAAVIAVTNGFTHWLGGSTWTLAFAALSALTVLVGATDLARALRHP